MAEYPADGTPNWGAPLKAYLDDYTLTRNEDGYYVIRGVVQHGDDPDTTGDLATLSIVGTDATRVLFLSSGDGVVLAYFADQEGDNAIGILPDICAVGFNQVGSPWLPIYSNDGGGPLDRDPIPSAFGPVAFADMSLGQVYISRNSSNGALEWTKTATGWVVTEGDTQWRDVSSVITGQSDGDGLLLIKRANDKVVVSINPLSAPFAWSDLVNNQLPDGFRPADDGDTAIQAPVNGVLVAEDYTPQAIFSISADGVFRGGYTGFGYTAPTVLDSAIVSATVEFTTTQISWPGISTSDDLPGVEV